ncbi:hypothetical protein Drorol1_Dr00022462 [Drosera rotundifolia]
MNCAKSHLSSCAKNPLHIRSTRSQLVGRRVLAMRRESGDRDFKCSGRLVDENMIVLRMRIQEIKMIEQGEETPSDWMGWEKKWYPEYMTIVCEAVGVLQSRLLDSRPAVAVGIVALVAMSVPTSVAMLLLHVMSSIHG